MTLSEFKKGFSEGLSGIYTSSEIQELFLIFAGKIFSQDRMEIRKNPEMKLENAQEKKFHEYLSELKTGKPFQLILGETEFFGMKFFVNRHTLIPRPETEELLELVLKFCLQTNGKTSQPITGLSTYNRQPLKILDIGTGSGIIPIVLKKYIPEAEISAMDISSEALKIAGKNAALHSCDIAFILADYLSMELSGKFDVIISNPPYISIDERPEIEDSVKQFEPENALFSPTEDPLVFYRKIAKDAEHHLAENGMIFLEINQKLGAETLKLFENFSESQLIKDISGNDRMIFVRK